jgi:hypothetical protein
MTKCNQPDKMDRIDFERRYHKLQYILLEEAKNTKWDMEQFHILLDYSGECIELAKYDRLLDCIEMALRFRDLAMNICFVQGQVANSFLTPALRQLHKKGLIDIDAPDMPKPLTDEELRNKIDRITKGE